MGTLRKRVRAVDSSFPYVYCFRLSKDYILIALYSDRCSLWSRQLQETSRFGDEQVLRLLESYVIRLLYVFFS